MKTEEKGTPGQSGAQEDEALLLVLERQAPTRGGLLERLPGVFRLIRRKYGDPMFRAMLVFHLGRMEGVRAERRRRGPRGG